MNDDDQLDAINREINLLLKRLSRKRIHFGNAGLALMSMGASLYQEAAGANETVELCRDIIDSIEGAGEAEMSETQH